jgi:hypothetical protein
VDNRRDTGAPSRLCHSCAISRNGLLARRFVEEWTDASLRIAMPLVMAVAFLLGAACRWLGISI